jgi:hypothetical protein
MREPLMDAGQQSELNDLKFRWDEAYDIGYDEASGVWSGRYLGSANELTSHTCDGLREKIRSDYQQRRMDGQRSLAGLQERSST